MCVSLQVVIPTGTAWEALRVLVHASLAVLSPWPSGHAGRIQVGSLAVRLDFITQACWKLTNHQAVPYVTVRYRTVRYRIAPRSVPYGIGLDPGSLG